MSEIFPTILDVQEAASRIQGYIRRTTMRESKQLNQLLGFKLLLKSENEQITGSFKVRGAFNNMLQLTDQEKQQGIMAVSAGNHAQGIAYAAKRFGIKATILMPSDAPRLKLKKTRGYGAKVELYDRAVGDREAMAREMSEECNLVFVHPFDNDRTIVGQGTIGLEIRQQCEAMNITPDALIVNCSGGGLAAGIALTQDLYKKPPEFFIAEPSEFNDAQRSLLEKKRIANEKTSGSICDALMSNIGARNLPILLRYGAQGLTATDDQVQAAMFVACHYFGQMLEPGGAVGLACAIQNRKQFRGKRVVVVASGGNVDTKPYRTMIRRGLQLLPRFPLAI